MAGILKILILFIYLAVIGYGTHFLRSRAFNRHEGVTFEFSFVTVLTSPLLFWKCGFSLITVCAFAVFILLFVLNGLAQRYFSRVLKERLHTAFALREKYMSAEAKTALEELAGKAVMPSFSRFIEESKMFSKQGGLIGLIKTSMRRQHFQDKKYQMRESFADMLNLIGPCRAEIGSVSGEKKETGKTVTRLVTPDDLALTEKDEKKGLAAFDILGFGGILLLFLLLIVVFVRPMQGPAEGASLRLVIGLVCAAVMTAAGFFLRKAAFAHREFLVYEISFAAVTVSAFFAVDAWLSGAAFGLVKTLVFLAAVLVYAGLTLFFDRRDKKAYACIKEQFEDILYEILPDGETGRVKRRFLRDLLSVSEWALVPSAGDTVEMYEKMNTLIHLVVPERDDLKLTK